MSGHAPSVCDGISIVSDGETPIIRTGDGERPGISEGGATDVVVANRLVAALSGRPLVQFRMGYGVHLELGSDHEVTIETRLEVVDGNSHWSGEPLTADAAGALLPLIQREITTGHVAADGTLVLGLGSAALTVSPPDVRSVAGARPGWAADCLLAGR